MALRPLAAGEIRLGEPLRRAVYDRHGVLLLREGIRVETELQRRGLLQRGFVQIARDAPVRPREPQRELADTAFGRVASLTLALERVHTELLTGSGTALPEALRRIADTLQQALLVEADATLAALQLGAADTGFVERHLHAAALCDLVGGVAGQPPQERQALLGAALTFDVGLAELAATLDAQTAPLSDAQREDLRAHPARSVGLLRRAGIDDAPWLDAVAQHHERIDGSGYPRGLQGAAIGTPARMLAIADIYTAMIRPRAHRGARQARAALRDIFLERGRQVDEALAALFIKELGIYPPGTLVRLRSGEIAVVTHRQADAAHPALRCVIGRDGVPLARPSGRDSLEPASAIVETVPAANYRCVFGVIERLWEHTAPEPASA